ncbi:hypothetical protein CEXT_399481 [Caerostris extrusa]|uniref:Uncharacterized protein n=1 Tax=Caerostris extrusa TaxID=172846 RepID=A0AAV4Y0R2_CAEEX|nr:hypothetical protein CEXT_399481 [Caerostris extrusa]
MSSATKTEIRYGGVKGKARRKGLLYSTTMKRSSSVLQKKHPQKEREEWEKAFWNKNNRLEGTGKQRRGGGGDEKDRVKILVKE